MKREDLIILIIGFLLLAGMLLTLLFGGEKSMHGVGFLDEIDPEDLPASNSLLKPDLLTFQQIIVPAKPVIVTLHVEGLST